MSAADGRQQMSFTVIGSMRLSLLHACVAPTVKDYGDYSINPKGSFRNSHEEYFCGCKTAEAIMPWQRSPDHNARGDLNGTLINRTDKLYSHACCCCWLWSVRRYANCSPDDENAAHTHTHTRREITSIEKKKNKKEKNSHLLKLVPHHLLL